MNSTNNRLESLNQKLKSVINKYSSLEKFFEHFFSCISVLRRERDHKAASLVQKHQVVEHLKNSAEERFCSQLTSYASEYVLQQLSLINKVKQPSSNGEKWKIESSEGIVVTSRKDCSCIFHLSMKLPCRHIFKVRQLLNLPLFDDKISDIRWHRSYFLSKHRVFMNNQSDPCHTISITSMERPKPKSKNQKFKQCMELCTKLADVLSDCGVSVFNDRMKQLDNLLSSWSQNLEVDFIQGILL